MWYCSKYHKVSIIFLYTVITFNSYILKLKFGLTKLAQLNRIWTQCLCCQIYSLSVAVNPIIGNCWHPLMVWDSHLMLDNVSKVQFCIQFLLYQIDVNSWQVDLQTFFKLFRTWLIYFSNNVHVSSISPFLLRWRMDISVISIKINTKGNQILHWKWP